MTSAKIDDGLGRLMSDYQVFYQKLRGYHWNVRGPQFFGLHAEFEKLYLDAAEKVDDLAERLAARGTRPPSTLRRALELARLAEDGEAPAAQDMVRNLIGDLETLGREQRALALAARERDPATANLLEDWADAQEQTRWMLSAFLAA